MFYGLKVFFDHIGEEKGSHLKASDFEQSAKVVVILVGLDWSSIT